MKIVIGGETPLHFPHVPMYGGKCGRAARCSAAAVINQSIIKIRVRYFSIVQISILILESLNLLPIYLHTV